MLGIAVTKLMGNLHLSTSHSFDKVAHEEAVASYVDRAALIAFHERILRASNDRFGNTISKGTVIKMEAHAVR